MAAVADVLRLLADALQRRGRVWGERNARTLDEMRKEKPWTSQVYAAMRAHHRPIGAGGFVTVVPRSE